jgi:putative DNA primase/helicase
MTRASTAPAVPEEDAHEGDGVDTLTDLGNAKRFAEVASGEMLHVPASGWGWMWFDGKRWARDSHGAAMELAARVAQSLRLEIDGRQYAHNVGGLYRAREAARHAMRSQGRERLHAMIETAAETQPEMKASVEDFDRNPDVLNVVNGTIDLRTGTLRPHNERDRLTQLVNVEYDPDALAPTWERTLREVLPDDEARAFLQRAAGYSATGHTREHALFFCCGGGRNGKSLVAGTILDLLGDYATPAPPNLLMRTQHERHATEIQNLRGYRLVKVDETGRGKAWNEERVKAFTGGDKLKGRRLYEDFDGGFVPTHKLWVLSNYRPRVTGTDDGIWSRFRLIDFPIRFVEPGDEEGIRAGHPVQRQTLREELRAEAPGILRWLVEGAVAWYQQGLAAPASVRRAVGEYRDQEDVLRDFIESYPALQDLAPGVRLPLEEVKRVYGQFTAAKEGIDHLDARELAAELRRRGFEVRRGTHGARFIHRAEARR